MADAEDLEPVELERRKRARYRPSAEQGGRLNFGCGPEPPPSWTNVDQVDYGQENHGGCLGDIRKGLPYDGGRFRVAVAHHSLQMIEYVDLVPALAELLRVLAPGGVLRISVPDLRGALDAWLRAEPGWFPIVDEAERHLGGKLCAYVTWYGEARTVFTHGWLAELCVRAGFAQTAICTLGLTLLADPDSGICDLDGRAAESIYLEAQR